MTPCVSTVWSRPTIPCAISIAARLTLASGQSIANVWNGINTGTSGAVTVRNAAYNGSLGGNASTSFGFLVNGSTNTAPGNISCTSP